MNMRRISAIAVCVFLAWTGGLHAKKKSFQPPDGRNIGFNAHWKFKRCEAAGNAAEGFQSPEFDDATWEPVDLPHTPKIEPLVVNDQWQGICWYRKHFDLDGIYKGRKIFIEFEAAMQVADVWVNGKHLSTHYGGYLPFTLDVTDDVLFDRANLIAVRLDNRDNPEVPPGKPLKELDFCMYGGLYRNVRMHITDRLHITDAVYAGQTAGGGVFAQCLDATPEHAQIRVLTHVANENPGAQTFTVVTTLTDEKDRPVAEPASDEVRFGGMESKPVVQTLDVARPKLWHPDSPGLYRLRSDVRRNGQVVDRVVTRIGIRRISFDREKGFRINGVKCDLRGTNRHQEYPYVGYALPNNAQYRDALKIKKAGFNLVRLSHYPHAPAFLDACDRLGILVMDAIPGWQYFGNDAFQRRSLQDCRDMIRRDRNHPSVVLWEVSLNESDMSDAFMEETHRIAHEEYPGDQCHTCGWRNSVYDVFIPARQHAAAPAYWKTYEGKRPLFIAEYGDWEYYAQNAGFNQPDYSNLSPEERNSRQLRGFGEKRLLQQAFNFQEALNDNLASPAIGSANWLMFDYNRGYADDIEASGIMDIFRIPKFAYYFYKSQRQPDGFSDRLAESPPMCYVASDWAEHSDLHIRVFSNCERVKLSINGKDVASQNPDRDAFSSMLAHPPFTFRVDTFQAGELEAIGFIDGKKAASHKVMTPLMPNTVRLTTGCDDIKPTPGEKDVFFVYASILDKNGSIIPTASDSIWFKIAGPGRLIGDNPVKAEAGIATIVVETTGEKGILKILSNKIDLFEAAAVEVQVQVD
jgi:beta-galactosidase